MITYVAKYLFTKNQKMVYLNMHDVCKIIYCAHNKITLKLNGFNGSNQKF